MNPEEKAEELIHTFKNYLQQEGEDFGEEILCTSIAVEHAKIVCDEIMKISEDRRLTQFFNKVKNKLEKTF